jgi:hypothetical protein
MATDERRRSACGRRSTTFLPGALRDSDADDTLRRPWACAAREGAWCCASCRHRDRPASHPLDASLRCAIDNTAALAGDPSRSHGRDRRRSAASAARPQGEAKHSCRRCSRGLPATFRGRRRPASTLTHPRSRGHLRSARPDGAAYPRTADAMNRDTDAALPAVNSKRAMQAANLAIARTVFAGGKRRGGTPGTGKASAPPATNDACSAHSSTIPPKNRCTAACWP